MRFPFRLLLVLLVVQSSSACWWVAGRTASALYPVVKGAVDPEEVHPAHPGDVVVPSFEDPGTAWERTILTAGGEVVTSASTLSPAEDIVLEWAIPVDIGAGVESVAALASPECLSAQTMAPSQWTLESASVSPGSSEVWRVSPDDLHSSSDGREVGVLAGEELRRKIGLPAHQSPTWLILAPRPGLYFLSIRWSGTPSSSILRQRPCIQRWVSLPMRWAVMATMGGTGDARAESAPPPEHLSLPGGLGEVGVPESVNDSDEGVSADVSPGGEGAAASGRDQGVQSRQPPGLRPDSVTPPEELARRLGLLGVAGYDLVLLHQLALQYRIQMQNGSASLTPDEQRVARLLRRDRLQKLAREQGVDAVRACSMLERQRLTTGQYALWLGEPTVPLSAVPSCSEP